VKLPDFSEDNTHQHHEHLEKLKKSVVENCYVCTRLWRRIFSDEDGPDSSLDTEHVDLRFGIESAIPPTGTLSAFMTIYFYIRRTGTYRLLAILTAVLSQRIDLIIPC
jgi:hypothetical protein